ncbi:MAG: 23S rRNA (uracil(1939)-C(5))-methyltransferase RlmD [Gammaproteobacteria bacterium]|nr:23S rRNA (uracil(1939)-C(5))-methyltransferase RlmD [Gammaproteobacteria bacterium]
MSRGPRPHGPPEEAVVAALNHDGEGVVREAKTVFVAGALPGERIRFRRVRQHRQHDEGELLEVLEASAARATPRCAHFGVCGGCSLQHLAPAAQLQAKQRELADNLERIGRVSPERWLEPLAGPVWNYRRRARLGAKFVPKRGRVLVGFRERAKPYIAALERCEILAPPLDALITPLSELLTGLAARASIPQIEVAVADNLTVLVLRNLVELGAADRAALAAFAVKHGLRIDLQPGGLDSIRPLDAAGAALEYRVSAEGLRYEFQATDFVQINGAVNQALIARTIELLELQPNHRVLDLFCGLGNFTLPIARRVAEVVGIEGEAGLVARARHNAALNDLHNARFHVANLAEADGGAAALAGRFARILLDPPRAGAIEVLPRLAGLGAERMVYVSCHPGTLARDLGVLCHEHGYKLAAAGVIDMFPHTNHVESIAVLEASR